MEATASSRARGETVDWWSELARRKLKSTAEWRWNKLENVGPDAVIVTGGIPKTLTRGKNKGKLSWRGIAVETCVITRTELATEQKAYEAETRMCSRCYGEGQEFTGWSKEHGTKYGACPRCKGTGDAPEGT